MEIVTYNIYDETHSTTQLAAVHSHYIYKQTSAKNHMLKALEKVRLRLWMPRKASIIALALPPEYWYSLIIDLFFSCNGCKTTTIVTMYIIKKHLLKQQNGGQNSR